MNITYSEKNTTPSRNSMQNYPELAENFLNTF